MKGLNDMQFYDKLRELESLTAIRTPKLEDAKKLLLFLKDKPEVERYFYEHNMRSQWVVPLRDLDQFKGIWQDEASVSDVEWAKADYLVRAAKDAPEDVAGVIISAHVRYYLVQGKLLEALLTMSETCLAKAVDVVCGYLEGNQDKQWYFVGLNAAKVMNKIANKHPDGAFQIADSLFEIWKPSRDKRRSPWEVNAKFSDFEYGELLRLYYPSLVDAQALRAIDLLITKLGNYLRSMSKDDLHSFEWNLSVDLENIDNARIGDRDIAISIIAAICDAGKKLMEMKQNKIPDLFGLLDKEKLLLFNRIQMHLLRFVPEECELERINMFIGDSKYLKDAGYWYEYRLLLNDKFHEIDKEAKAVFEHWIEEQRFDADEIERFKEWFERTNGIKATESDIAAHEKRRQARELYLVRDHYRELFEECLQVSGAKENEVAPRPRHTESFFGSPTQGSPKTVDELLDIEPQEVIRYLKSPSEWVVKKDPLITNTPEQALSGAFEEVVKKRPKDYVALSTKAIAGLRPIFIRDYYYALKEVVRTQKLETSSFWPAILEISIEVVKAHGPSNSRDYSSCLLAVLGLVEEGLNKGPSEMPASDENLMKAYDIAKGLLGYSFGSDMDPDESMDPYTGSLNCVQGQAFRLILRLGIRAKNKVPKLFDSFFAQRVRETLDWSIGEGKKPKVISVLGSWFIHVYWLDEEWTKHNLDNVFDENALETWHAAWDSYIVWGKPSTQAFDLLLKTGKYSAALRKLFAKEPKDADEEYTEEDRRLIEHLMIAFFNEWVEPDHALLQQFWKEGPPSLKAHATEFLTTGFSSPKEDKDGKRKEEIAARLLAFWESRLEVIKENPEVNSEEALRLIGWIEDSPFDAGDALRLLERTLFLTDGEVGPYSMYYEFVDNICKIAKEHEVEAIRCIIKAVNQKKNQTAGFRIEENFNKLLNWILDLADDYSRVDEIRREAMKMADAFGRRNLELQRFRDIYDKLREKVKEV